MTEYIELLYQWVATHQDHAWWIIFLIAFVESTVLLGILIPGLPLMLMLGSLIAAKVLDPWTVIFWCIIGAIVGDGLSFWIGKYFRRPILNMWPLNKHPGWVAQGESFFARWGGISILFGRFFGPLRATIPVLAGVLGMSQRRFTGWNIFSAILWAPAYLMPGFILGWVTEHSEHGAWAALGLLLLFILAYWYWKRCNKGYCDDPAYLARQAEQAQQHKLTPYVPQGDPLISNDSKQNRQQNKTEQDAETTN